MSICPICGAPVEPRSANKAFPFCTARCKAIDLGKWLDEAYCIPAPADESEGESGERGAQPHGDDDEGGSPPKGDMRH